MSTVKESNHNPILPAKEKQPQKNSDNYDSEDADIELISSDNVIFRVHSYRLQCASPVFRSMIALASCNSQRDSIHLSDAILENSKIVEKALDIIYTYHYDVDLMKFEFDLIKFVIDFAKKWEISMIIDIISRGLSSEMKYGLPKGNGQLFEQFLVSVQLDDNKLASSVFGLASYHEAWLADEEGQVDTGEADEMKKSDEVGTHYLSDIEVIGLSGKHPSLGDKDGNCFNFGAMTYKEFLKFRPTIVWIILRSEILKNERGNMSGEKIVLELLDKAYPPSKSAESSKKRKAED